MLTLRSLLFYLISSLFFLTVEADVRKRTIHVVVLLPNHSISLPTAQHRALLRRPSILDLNDELNKPYNIVPREIMTLRCYSNIQSSGLSDRSCRYLAALNFDTLYDLHYRSRERRLAFRKFELPNRQLHN